MLRVKDKADSYAIDIPGWFSITPRVLLIGKSQYSGKTTFVINAMLRETMFGPYYEGNNIAHRRSLPYFRCAVYKGAICPGQAYFHKLTARIAGRKRVPDLT